MQPRHQKGYLFKSSGWWFVRYCDTAVTNGEAKRVLIAKKLVPISSEYRSKRSVQPIAEEFLRPINDGLVTPQSSMALGSSLERNTCRSLNVKSGLRQQKGIGTFGRIT